MKGLIYLDVPIEDDDFIILPPLEGFVMNRVTGDYFETLLYKLFVSIDEKTTVAELSNVLQIDLSLVKNAISMYCRLGFAHKKSNDTILNQYHPSWRKSENNRRDSTLESNCDVKVTRDISQFVDSLANETDESDSGRILPSDVGSSSETSSNIDDQNSASNVLLGTTQTINSHFGSLANKRLAFMYDSTLAAFLMMGNLSPGLKNHAVTMFEVGKLPEESIDSLLLELSKISDANMEDEGGEAERYFLHAIILYRTVQFLRHNSTLTGNIDEDTEKKGLSIDLIRCESLLNLEIETCRRLLHKNYSLVISVAPLSNETRLVMSDDLPHLGPASPLINSVWFKMYIYHLTESGPPSLLLSRGTRLFQLPEIFENFEMLMITPWNRDSGIIPVANALITINDAATHSALLVQAYSNKPTNNTNEELVYVPFPLDEKVENGVCFENHPVVQCLSSKMDLQRTCGYITLVDVNFSSKTVTSGLGGDEPNDVSKEKFENWTLFDCHFGIPLFDRALNKQVCKKLLSHQLCNSDK